MKKAQTSFEHILLIIIIVAALITMQAYIKRGIQGSWRRGIDELGEQYEPKKTRADLTYTVSSNTISTLSLDRSVIDCERANDINPCYSFRTDASNILEITTESINVEGF